MSTYPSFSPIAGTPGATSRPFAGPSEAEGFPDGPAARLHADTVAELVGVQAFPSISVLLSTTPAPVMTRRDADRLQRLLDEVTTELRRRRVLNTREFLVALHALADSATSQPTDQSLALFVNRAVQRTLRLPIPVRTRAVVEDTFATRDLVRALHRTPPHLMLLLQPACAQLYRGTADTLAPVRANYGFPIQRRLTLPAATETDDTFLRRVDTALGRYRHRHPSPLIVAGHSATVERFLARSYHRHRLAGTITGTAVESPTQLHKAARTALQTYLLSRQDEAVHELARAGSADQSGAKPGPEVVSGAAACWTAVRRGAPVMLAVEETYVQPARLTPATTAGVNSERVELLEDSTHHTGDLDDWQIRSDLIDDLIETVITRGGWVALVDDGRLTDHQRVALIVRPATGRAAPAFAPGVSR